MINYLIVMKINKYKFHCIFSLFFEDQWSRVIEILETTENKDFPQMEEFIGLWLKAHINDKKTRKKLDWYLEKELSVTKENYNQNIRFQSALIKSPTGKVSIILSSSIKVVFSSKNLKISSGLFFLNMSENNR